MTLQLYGSRQSRAGRCLWLLEELGVPFEHVPVDLAAGANRTPEYLAINPAGKVPTLVDGDFVLRESTAINCCLAERHPTPLWPDDPQTRARILQWSSWAITELEPPFTAIVREKRAAAGAARDADDLLIAGQLSAVATTLATLETALAERPWLAADTFTLADLNAATAVMLAPLFLDMATFPASAAWLDRCLARPAWARVQARP